MTRIVIDADMRHKLLGLNQRVELCDESGRVLARVVPTLDPSEYEDLEPQISEEEMRRRVEHRGRTYTTAEVLAYLESL
jgi:hypothetical protein